MPSTSKTSIVIGGSTKELEAAVDRAIGKLTGLVVAAAGIFAGAATFNWGYDLLKQSEAAEIGFTQMLGSADLAKETLKQLADYAAKTPFDNPTLVKAYRNLLNFKFSAEDIPGILRVLGDTAAAMPEGMTEGMNRLTIIMGQMKSKAKLSSQEMMQLTETGINAWEYLRQGLNVSSVAEAVAKVEAGAVDSATGVRAVLSGMEKDFNGVGEKMSKSVEGLMSTITDNAGRGLQAIFKGATGGEFKTWLADLGDGLNTLGTTGEAIGERIAQGFQIVKNIFDGIWAVCSTIGDVLKAAFGVDDLSIFALGLHNLRTDFEAVKTIAFAFIQGASIGFAMVGDAVSQYLVDPLIAFIGTFTAGLGVILDGLATIADHAEKTFNTAGEALANVAGASGALARAKELRGESSGIGAELRGLADALKQAGKNKIDGAIKDFNAGPVMQKKVEDFFGDMEKKRNHAASPAGQMEKAMQGLTDDLDLMSGNVLDFNRAIKDMASLAPIVGGALAQLAKEAEDARRKQAQQVLKDSKSPLEKFKAELSDLEQMLKSGDINPDAFNAATADRFKTLASSLPGYNPNAGMAAGSVEAQSAIVANRQGGGNRVEDILKQVEQEARLTRKANEELVKRLKNSKIIPVGI